jgi:hypothetical protein
MPGKLDAHQSAPCMSSRHANVISMPGLMPGRYFARCHAPAVLASCMQDIMQAIASCHRTRITRLREAVSGGYATVEVRQMIETYQLRCHKSLSQISDVGAGLQRRQDQL